MKTELLEAPNGLDRPATPDEIQTALALFADFDVAEGMDDSLEIPSDRGGYVRIGSEELELFELLEDANEPT